MAWYAYVADFFAGFLLANGVPHFVNGISGRRFPTPFARPPGQGESSPSVNVLWGLANFLAGLVLAGDAGKFTFGANGSSLLLGLGALVTSVTLAMTFGKRGRG